MPDSGGEVDQGRTFHAGKLAQTIEGRLVGEHGNRDGSVFEILRYGHLGEAGGVGRHGGKHGDVRGVESQAGLFKIPESAEEQAGADQKKGREGDFAGDQPSAELPPMEREPTPREAACKCGLRDWNALPADAGSSDESTVVSDGDGSQDEHDGPVNGNGVGAGNGVLGQLADAHHGELSEQHAHAAAEKTEQQAFREHLTYETHAPGAQCGAHRELLLAAQATGDQQVGHIGAGDQEHQAKRAEERVEHRASPAR